MAIVKPRLGFLGPVTALAYSSCGRLILAGCGPCLRSYDVATGRLLVEVAVLPRGVVHGLVVSPDGALVVAYGHKRAVIVTVAGLHGGDGTAPHVWDVCSLRELVVGVAWWEHGGTALRLVLGLAHARVAHITVELPPGDAAAAVTTTSTVRCHTRSLLYCMAMRQDGDALRVASGSVTSDILVWDGAVDGRVLFRLRGHHVVVYKLAWSPAGDRLLSAGDDRSLRMWGIPGDTPSETADLAPLWTTWGHRSRLWDCGFMPASETVMSTAEDATLRLWDNDGNLVATCAGHRGKHTWTCAVAPDGTTAVSGGGDGAIHVWDVAVELGRGRAGAAIASHTFKVPSGAVVEAVVVLSGGRGVLAADQRCAVWRLEAGDTEWTAEWAPVVPANDAVRPPACLLVSPCGGRVLVVSVDGTATVARLDGSRPPVVWDAAPSTCMAACWFGSTDVLVANHSTVRVWSAAEGGAPSLRCILQLPASFLPATLAARGTPGVAAVGASKGNLALFRLPEAASDPVTPACVVTGVGCGGRFGLAFPSDGVLSILAAGWRVTARVVPTPEPTLSAWWGNPGHRGDWYYPRSERKHTAALADGAGQPGLAVACTGVCSASPLVTGLAPLGDHTVFGWHGSAAIVKDTARGSEGELFRCSGVSKVPHAAWATPDGTRVTFVTRARTSASDAVGLYCEPAWLPPPRASRRLLGLPVPGLLSNCVAWVPSAPAACVVGAEDHVLHVYTCDGGVPSGASGLHGHLSSVRSIQCVEVEAGRAVMVSTGGNSCVLSWLVDTASSPPGIEFLASVGREAEYISQRTSGATVFVVAGRVFVATGSSDGTVSVFEVNVEARDMRLVVESVVGTGKPVLAVCHAAVCGGAVLILAACSDGSIAVAQVFVPPTAPWVWPREAPEAGAGAPAKHSLSASSAGEAVAVPGFALRPVAAIAAHAMGANCLSVKVIAESRVCVVSGGDDEAVAVSLLTCTPGATTVDVAVESKTHTCVASAAVNGVFTDGTVAMSASLDQRVNVWTLDGTDLVFVASEMAELAAVSGMAVRPTGPGAYDIMLSGQGVQALHVDVGTVEPSS